jgi:hypothetical protein
MVKFNRLFRAVEIAEYIDVTKTTVANLTKRGVLSFAKDEHGETLHGCYDLVEVSQNYLSYLREQAKRNGNDEVSIANAKAGAARQIALAEREIIQTNLLKGTVLKIEDINRAVLGICQRLRKVALAYPARVAPMILGKDELKQVVHIMTTEMESDLVKMGNL